MSASDHFILLSAMTLAYAVFGMTGFGAAMVAVPILVHILPLEFAVPLILLMDIVATVSVGFKSRRHVVLAELRRLLPSLLVGVLLGATILSRIKSGWLLIALGVFVLAMSARSFFMRRAAAQPIGWQWSVPAGMAGGIFSALFGTGGPVYTMYLARRLPDLEAFRATIAALIFLSAIARSGAFAVTGLLQEPLFTTALRCLPFCLLGLFAGSLVRRRVPPPNTRNLLLALQHAVQVRGELRQRDAVSDSVQSGGPVVARDFVPHLAPQRHRAVGIDADQADAAQDEGQDGQIQFGAADVAKGADDAFGLHGAGQPGQGLAAYRIDGAGPAGFFQRLRAGRVADPPDHLAGAQGLQRTMPIPLAGHRRHLVAAPGQHVDGDAGHPSGGARHQHRAALGGQAVVFHPVQRQAGGVACRAQYCGLQQRQAPGQGQHPVSPDTGPLRMAALMVYTDAKAVHDDLAHRRETHPIRNGDAARQVDAADARELADDAVAPVRGQRVLVVDAGVGHFDQHIAGAQIAGLQGFDAARRFGFAVMQAQGLEGGHGRGFPGCRMRRASALRCTSLAPS